MKTFEINDHLQIICEWKKTRTAFKHEATLLKDGLQLDKVKICYLNRTWESFDFESVIQKLLDQTKILTEAETQKFMDQCAGNDQKETDRQFGQIAAIAKMGEIIHAGNAKAQNDWKARMLKAGLESRGLIMPDDWDQLAEEDKAVRLDGVIAQLTA